MEYIIDRFEGEFAVLEKNDGKTYSVIRDILPLCDEGDRVIISIEKSNQKETQTLFKSLLKD